MNKAQTIEFLREMMTDGDEDTFTPAQMHHCWQEALDDGEVPEQDVIEQACDALVAEGVLQKAGRNGYELTDAYLEAHEKHQAETVAGIFAEHYIKKAAQK